MRISGWSSYVCCSDLGGHGQLRRSDRDEPHARVRGFAGRGRDEPDDGPHLGQFRTHRRSEQCAAAALARLYEGDARDDAARRRIAVRERSLRRSRSVRIGLMATVTAAAPAPSRLDRAGLGWALFEGGRIPYVVMLGVVFMPYFAQTDRKSTRLNSSH